MAGDTTIETVDRGRRHVARRARIDAPAPELFALVADPMRHHELDGAETVQSVVRVDGPMRAGSHFTMAMKLFGMPYHLTSTVTEVVPDRVVEWQHPQGHRWRYEFDPVDATTTDVTEVWDYSTAKGARMLEWTRFPRRNAHGIEQTLRRLQRRHTTPGARETR